MMNIEKRRLVGRSIVSKRYYSLLKKITTNVSILDNIVSLEMSDSIIDDSEEGELLYFKTYLFKDRTNIKEDVLKFVHADKGYYLWTEDSFYCGHLYMPNLLSFNFEFEFDDDENGIIVFSYPDKKILMDYYEEAGNYYVDLKVFQLLSKETGLKRDE